VTEDDSNDEKSGTEVDSCAKGSRTRKAVPPPEDKARIQFNVTRKEEKGVEKRTAETECALASKEQKDCRLGRNAVGVLLASREVQGRMDLARR